MIQKKRKKLDAEVFEGQWHPMLPVSVYGEEVIRGAQASKEQMLDADP